MSISSSPVSSIANMQRTYTQIASTTLSSDASSVNFNTIPSTYTDLIIFCYAEQYVDTSILLRFNSDTTTSYEWRGIYLNDVTTQDLNESYGLPLTSSGSTTEMVLAHASVMSYASTSIYKTLISRCADYTDGFISVGTWRKTDAITSLQIRSGSGNFKSGAVFSIFGIKKA